MLQAEGDAEYVLMSLFLFETISMIEQNEYPIWSS